MPTQITVDELLAMIWQMCPDCQAKLRGKLALYQPPRNGLEVEAESIYPIVHHVAEKTGVPVNVICGSDNRRVAVEARRLVALQARGRGFSYPAIGKALNKHHTTILHLVRGGIPTHE